jgi:hypothetical protein
MDPNMPNAQDWHQILPLLQDLWLFVLFMVGFAGNLMLSHAVIPSLVGTHHIPQRASSLRPILYLVSALSFLVAMYIFYNLSVNLAVIYEIYPKRFI